ncbi:hypothetical protein Cgig2_018821 [Carnegiea gigantea]|uniref:GATA transcription factor n=1 Tax=Carnegiea gigantea TaxID=171969 RepID=A0A9Q1KID6_9CARY|nr:hypothetical protein Cgig2_018821 [Carnegiea gigantea]
MEASASEFGYCPQPPTKPSAGDHFIVEELLDFSNDDAVVNEGGFDNNNNNHLAAANSNSTDSSSVVTPVDSCNSSFSGNNDLNFPTAGDMGSQFSGDLCVPYDELAELEWLSNFVEESFSSEDLQKLQLISGMSAMKTRPTEAPQTTGYYQPDPPRPINFAPSPIFSPEMPVPGKARSKRSRAAPGNWASRLLVLSSSANNPAAAQPVVPSVEPVIQPGPVAGMVKPTKTAPKKKTPGGAGAGNGSGSGSDLPNGEVRKCLHCATDKTPQWRTGPMGPKTLCNACGVRYKSGRLVPEYRPAASPTFVLTKHSNSHRKVMELRRQKELMRQQQLQQQQQYQQQLMHHPTGSMMFDPTSSDDYLIHQHIGPDFRQLI